MKSVSVMLVGLVLCGCNVAMEEVEDVAMEEPAADDDDVPYFRIDLARFAGNADGWAYIELYGYFAYKPDFFYSCHGADAGLATMVFRGEGQINVVIPSAPHDRGCDIYEYFEYPYEGFGWSTSYLLVPGTGE